MTIAKVSEITGLSADTLRYYEKLGLLSDVQRKSSGIRDYTDENISRINFIKCIRSTGMSLEDIAEYVRLYEEGDSTVPNRLDLLLNQKEKLDKKLDALNETRVWIEKKINLYNEKMKSLSK